MESSFLLTLLKLKIPGLPGVLFWISPIHVIGSLICVVSEDCQPVFKLIHRNLLLWINAATTLKYHTSFWTQLTTKVYYLALANVALLIGLRHTNQRFTSLILGHIIYLHGVFRSLSGTLQMEAHWCFSSHQCPSSFLSPSLSPFSFSLPPSSNINQQKTF